MPTEETNFQAFLVAKIKDRAVSIKKLSEVTGITPMHLEALVHGRWDDLPSAPYVRGYLVRLGKALDFNGLEWWERMKAERVVSNSGSGDTLPNNRFLRQSYAKFIWVAGVVVVVIIYLIFRIVAAFAGPQLTVSFPTQNPYTTESSTLTLTGTVSGADSLSLDNGTGAEADSTGSDSGTDLENITIAPDGSWQKSVLLQNGQNTFQIVAKKLLGGSTEVTEQIFYDGSASANQPTTESTSSATSTTGSGASSTTTSSTP